MKERECAHLPSGAAGSIGLRRDHTHDCGLWYVHGVGVGARVSGICAVGLDGQGSLLGTRLRGRQASAVSVPRLVSRHNSTAGEHNFIVLLTLKQPSKRRKARSCSHSSKLSQPRAGKASLLAPPITPTAFFPTWPIIDSLDGGLEEISEQRQASWCLPRGV